MRGQKGDIFFSHGAVRAVGRKGEGEGAGFQKWRVFRERSSTFSLKFSAIRLSVSSEVRSKVVPHGKGYIWVPVLWSFDKLQEVGVFSYLIYPLFKCFVNAWVDLRS